MRWPYIKLYPRDWWGDKNVQRCGLKARAVWFEMLLLMHSAQRRGFLEDRHGNPIDDETLAFDLRCTAQELEAAKAELLRQRVPSVDLETGLWFNRRMVEEEAKLNGFREAGKRGGNPSLASHPKDIPIPIPIPIPTVGITPRVNPRVKGGGITLPITPECGGGEVSYVTRSTHDTSISPEGGPGETANQQHTGGTPPLPPPFERFWAIYPRKIGKLAAKRAWDKARRQAEKPDVSAVLAAVEAQKQSKAWLKDSGQYIPHPSTWLNQGRWADEVAEREGEATKGEW